MKTTVYHCSPDCISKFNFERGVHFGGQASALKAGKRKLSNLKNKKEYRKQKTVFLHVCELDLTSEPVYETFDKGGDEEWQKEISFARADGYRVLSYQNKYEPDTVPSYIILDEGLVTVKQILEGHYI